MERQDMALISEELGFSERLFLTRHNGKQAYRLLEACLQKVNESQGLILAFPSNQLIDASFADETIIRLGEEIVAGNFGERCILLEGLTEDSITNINSIIKLRQLKLAFLAIEPLGAWQCLGQLEPSLKETVELVSQRGSLTAPEVTALLGLAINSASNRLKRLHDQHLVWRDYEVTPKGLQYTYHFWQWQQ